MSMTKKELYSNDIRNLLFKKGYVQNKKFSFRKMINDHIYSQLFLTFSGSELVSVSPVYGVYIENIENDVKSSTFSERLKGQAKLGMPTIFFDASLANKSFNTKNLSVDFDISLQREKSFCAITNILECIELGLSSNDTIIMFLKDYGTSLAIGHHCFRVPFVFKRGKEYKFLSKYIEYILEVDFIQNYRQFVDDNIYKDLPCF